MKRITPLALCVFLVPALSVLSGCVVVNPLQGGIVGKGDPEIYSVSVGEINEIKGELFCNIQVFATPSDTITLEIQPNLREYVMVEESAGVLTVRTTRNIIWSDNAPVLTVSTSALNHLSLTGAGDFTANDPIIADSFTLDLAGAGTGKAELDVRTLFVTMSGAGSYTLSGKAETADLRMDGAGKIDALALQTQNAMVRLSGIGAIRIACSEALRIEAGGMGTVEYRGSPSVDLSRDGLVSVKKVD